MSSTKNIISICFLALVLAGCETEDQWLCSTGPIVFTFEVVDKATGENLFTTGLYEESQISIKNKAGESVEVHFKEYHFNGGTKENLIEVLLGWEIKSDIYQVSIGEEIDFDIYFELDRSKGEHCSNIVLTELKIEGIASKRDEATGITQILVETNE